MEEHTEYQTLTTNKDGRIATITLNRPDRLNAIDTVMPGEIRAAVEQADMDADVHVIVVAGAGRAFCAGYDLKAFAEDPDNVYTQAMPWDPISDYRFMHRCTENFMSLWRCSKPTIARVQGHAVAGGSDIAMCCDLIVMGEDARIGYPPARVWGCPTTAMWVYRVGVNRAKRMLLTGETISGQAAYDIGLAAAVAPESGLDEAVGQLAEHIAAVPRNQLAMQKLVINQAIDAQGLPNSQLLATIFDGITRHSPEGLWFKRYAEELGFHEAVKWRDSGRNIPDGDETKKGGG